MLYSVIRCYIMLCYIMLYYVILCYRLYILDIHKVWCLPFGPLNGDYCSWFLWRWRQVSAEAVCHRGTWEPCRRHRGREHLCPGPKIITSLRLPHTYLELCFLHFLYYCDHFALDIFCAYVHILSSQFCSFHLLQTVSDYLVNLISATSSD